MSSKIKNIIGNIFNPEEKEKQAQQNKTTELQQKTKTVFGTKEKATNISLNPFLNKNGELINPHFNYQKMLDSPYIPQKVKEYITQATGLSSSSSVKISSSPKPQMAKKISSTSSSKQSSASNASTSKNVSVGKADGTIVNEAKKYLGTPYVWSGDSVSDGGMDCSGFVYNALKDAGYNVGRTSAEGYRKNGTTVSKNNLQPGDLIFYGKNGNASHMGIYIGNGQMIHSSGGSSNTKSNPGKGVSITNVDYRSDFIEAKRY